MIDVSVLISVLMALEGGTGFGDGGRARGSLQIHHDVVADVNYVYGTAYVHADADDAVKASTICWLYLSHYGRAERIGRTPSVSDFARIWNGGPNGYRRKCTEEYGHRAENLYASMLKRPGRDSS